ncbi:MAG: aldo/keto reductase [Mogibacterium sp.]|nr:aldo/keto reductase [Mogibacterium sp.]
MGVIESKKKLGFGMMRMPLLEGASEDGDFAGVDLEQTKAMVDEFIARGFTYFDTARLYHNFKCEQVAREVLTSRYPRDAYTVAAKMHTLYFKKDKTAENVFRTDLVNLGIDYIDYYLVHDVGHDNYKFFEENGAFECCVKMKKEGLVKHIGFSCHDTAEFIDRVLTEHPEMEFVQIQLNYLDWNSAGINSHACYDVITKHGKEVIVMEPVKGGTLANVPPEVERLFKTADADSSVASWAIRFAASHENVKMVLSGMSSMEQMKDNLATMENFKALTDEEFSLIEKAVAKINESIEIACTACRYCVDGCPMNIPIPNYFSLYNTQKQKLREEPDAEWTPEMEYFERLTTTKGKPSDCIGCGSCEGICPQHLPIIDDLKKVSELMEK